MQLVKMSYQIHQLNQVHKKMTIKNEELKVQLAELLRPDRLAKIGEEQFDLKKPKTNQIWIFNSNEEK